jgi:hypothetical protein
MPKVRKRLDLRLHLGPGDKRDKEREGQKREGHKRDIKWDIMGKRNGRKGEGHKEEKETKGM